MILFSPASRVLTYLLALSFHGVEGIMLRTLLDLFMIGRAMALLQKSLASMSFAQRLLGPGLFAFSVFYVIVFRSLLSSHFEARYDLTVGFTVRGS
jgi:hypothetical protein